MKKLLIGAVTVTALAIASVPASAEIWAGADEGGVVYAGPGPTSAAAPRSPEDAIHEAVRSEKSLALNQHR